MFSRMKVGSVEIWVGSATEDAMVERPNCDDSDRGRPSSLPPEPSPLPPPDAPPDELADPLLPGPPAPLPVPSTPSWPVRPGSAAALSSAPTWSSPSASPSIPVPDPVPGPAVPAVPSMAGGSATGEAGVAGLPPGSPVNGAVVAGGEVGAVVAGAVVGGCVVGGGGGGAWGRLTESPSTWTGIGSESYAAKSSSPG